MLALKHKKNDRINFSIDGKRIGQVVVNKIRGNEVCLGFEFMPEVKILRGELLPDSPVQKDACGEGK